MILPIVAYGHPVLRQKGAEIGKPDQELEKLAADMLETMYAAQGVGLAAQQIGKAIQMCVIDVRDSERPSQLFMGVREVSLEESMPMILLNPKISREEGREEGVEGCLSFPGMTGDVPRAISIQVTARDLKGNPLTFMATGFLARAIQHEMDHLNGVLFIDRMTPPTLSAIKEEVALLKKKTEESLKKKKK